MGILRRLAGKVVEEVPSAAWPAPGEGIWVRLPCCESDVHSTHVESATSDRLVILAPAAPHPQPVDPPRDGKTFIAGWNEGALSKQARFECVSTSKVPIPAWTIAPVSDAQLLQRRQYVRAGWDAEIKLHVISGAVRGRIVDISEGGLRCTFPAMNEPREERFPVSFVLDGAPLMVDVEVAWWGRPHGYSVQVGLTFVTDDRILQDRLRGHAFALQLEERRKKVR